MPMPGYFSKVAAIVPTAHGRGSTNSAAPYFLAATTPAPYFISPWVSVGPSSITKTLLPLIFSYSSTKRGDAASTTTALGLAASMFCRTVSTSDALAVSILLITTTSANRRLVSPGWYFTSWPGRCGSTRVI